MKLKKTKKSIGARGQTNHGHGARKKWRKSGHKGGVGMAGSGKRADQKKSLVLKKYGNKYFGKKGLTSKSTAKKKILKINLGDIERNLDNLMKKYGKNGLLDLSNYEVLGKGEGLKVKLRVREISGSAKDKIERAGGSVEVLGRKDDESKEVQSEEGDE